jgi:hypothetical protein
VLTVFFKRKGAKPILHAHRAAPASMIRRHPSILCKAKSTTRKCDFALRRGEVANLGRLRTYMKHDKSDDIIVLDITSLVVTTRNKAILFRNSKVEVEPSTIWAVTGFSIKVLRDLRLCLGL